MNGTGDGTLPTNEGTIKVVTRTLAAIALISVCVVCVLAFYEKQIPPELNTVMGGSIAALTAMLVNTRPSSSTDSKPAQELKVPEQTIQTQTI